MKKKENNIILIIAVILVIALIGVVCYGYVKKATYSITKPIATMEIENMGTIKIELDPEEAPNTVKNFIALANNGFYDGLTFHRVVKDFMIQGGDKKGDGTGAPTLSAINKEIEEGSAEDKEYSIKGEFKKNGIDNNIKFEKGVIAMARSDYSSFSSELAEKGYNSAGSQFFIVTKPTASLNGNYAPFGKVIEGMDVVDKIEGVEIAEKTEENTSTDKPVNPPVIKSIRVETNGVEYGMPKTEEPFDYTNWLYSQYGINQ